MKKEARNPERKSKPFLTARQCAFASAYAQTHSETKAALIAGYSPKNPGQSGHQVLRAISKKMPDLMDELGLSLEALIEKHLIPLLNAEIIKLASKNGKFTDYVFVPDNLTQLKALDMALRLHGAYPAPQQAKRPVHGMRVIIVDPSEPSRTIDAIDAGSTPRGS